MTTVYIPPDESDSSEPRDNKEAPPDANPAGQGFCVGLIYLR